MSAFERVVAVFLDPAALPDDAPPMAPRPAQARDARLAAPAVPAAPDGEGAPTARAPLAAASSLVSPAPMAGRHVCVLAGGRAASALGDALAAHLARAPGARCAVVVRAGGDDERTAAALPAPPAPTARRLHRGLVLDGEEAAVRGRVVTLTAPSDRDGLAATLARVTRRAPAAPVVTVIPGARCTTFDPVVAAHELIVVVVDAEAPPTLPALALAEVQALAPAAAVQVVALPARLGASARRAAAGRAMEVLR